MQEKKGISLIVLVITITDSYDKWLKASKIGKVPPNNKLEIIKKHININRVANLSFATLIFITSIV